MYFDKETEKRIRYVYIMDKAVNTGFILIIVSAFIAFYIEILSLN